MSKAASIKKAQRINGKSIKLEISSSPEERSLRRKGNYSSF